MFNNIYMHIIYIYNVTKGGCGNGSMGKARAIQAKCLRSDPQNPCKSVESQLVMAACQSSQDVRGKDQGSLE